jgi:hypothetical protein
MRPCALLIATAALVCVSLLGQAAAQVAVEPAGDVGLPVGTIIPLKPDDWGVVTLRDLPPPTARAPGSARAIPRLAPPWEELAPAPGAAPVPRAPLGGGGAILMPSPVRRIDGINDSSANYYVTPPDVNGAVGPNHLVESLNDGIRMWRRSDYTVVLNTDLDTWYGTGLGWDTTVCCDPHTLYDPDSGRWFQSCLDIQENTTTTSYSWFYLSCSETDDPTGAWYNYRFQVDLNANGFSDDWLDYDLLGCCHGGVYVSGNIFSWAGLFQESYVYEFSKADVTDGPPLNVKKWTGFVDTRTPTPRNVFTVVPVQTLGTDPGYMYLVSHSRTYYLDHAWQFQNPGNLATSTMSRVGQWSVASYNAPATVPQYGSTYKVDGGDTRIINAVYRDNNAGANDGSIWYSHTVSNPTTGTDGVRWYEVTVAGTYPATLTKRQEGNIATSDWHLTYPSIAVNGNGDTAVGFTAVKPADATYGHYNAGYTFRSSGDALNTMQPAGIYWLAGVIYANSTSYDRWGDYSATVSDPNSTTDFWTLQEYAHTANTNGSGGWPYARWGTAWAQIPPGPNAVRVVGLRARPAAGGVEVSWETGTEIGTLGFNVLRAESEKGPYERANARLIPATASPTAEGAYHFVDRTARPGRTYYYRIAEVMEDGATVDCWETASASRASSELYNLLPSQLRDALTS